MMFRNEVSMVTTLSETRTTLRPIKNGIASSSLARRMDIHLLILLQFDDVF